MDVVERDHARPAYCSIASVNVPRETSAMRPIEPGSSDRRADPADRRAGPGAGLSRSGRAPPSTDPLVIIRSRSNAATYHRRTSIRVKGDHSECGAPCCPVALSGVKTLPPALLWPRRRGGVAHTPPLGPLSYLRVRSLANPTLFATRSQRAGRSTSQRGEAAWLVACSNVAYCATHRVATLVSRETTAPCIWRHRPAQHRSCRNARSPTSPNGLTTTH
jgi:hypothetical protein